MEKARVGLGIITFNRPEYFKKCIDSVLKNCKSVDHLFIYNDGSHDDKYDEIMSDVMGLENPYSKPITYFPAQKNKGVAVAKNWLLKQMMDEECEHLFLLEDDILIKSDKAITGYIEASEKSGLKHLNFAWHGKGNRAGALYKDDVISYHKECIGAFSYYSRHALEELKNKEEAEGYEYAGLMDEKMFNAFEHVFLTKKLGDMGFTSPFWLFADATGSEEWLEEIPGSIENSSIRPRPDWQDNIKKSMERWKSLDGKGIPLQE